ncbi:PIN domain-containing protein [Achromobacter xylosoxidans]
MTLRFVLDTNICIFAIKNKPGAVRQALNRRPGQLCVSAITAMELRYGAEKSATPARNHAVIDGFLKRLEVLNYDRAAAAHAATTGGAGASRHAHRPLRCNDRRPRPLSGFCACHEQHSRVFPVSGLRLDDWTQ